MLFLLLLLDVVTLSLAFYLSPNTFTKLLRPLVKFSRIKGLRIVFFDDGWGIKNKDFLTIPGTQCLVSSR
jgi:hypothetical protein